MIPVATGVAALSLGAGVASAADGGGVGTPAPPQLRDLRCVEKCAGIRAATVGSIVQLSGENLADVDEVTFAPRLAVQPTGRSAKVVEARVPEAAETGKVKVSAYGTEAQSKQQLQIVNEAEIPGAGAFKLSSVTATPRKSFYDSARGPRVSYLFQGGSKLDVRIDVVDRETGQVVSSFIDKDAKPNALNVARWNGRSATGKLARSGKYRFKVGSLAAGKTETEEGASFGFYEYRFPVPGRHSYGDGFGAGRGHQGQDVFARCGSKLLAARGGRVQWNRTHSAAGHYLVIDGRGTGNDFMYAHLQRPSPLEKGDRVRTGQLIGRVGDTGNASGCHLHFEIWSAPGWYQGGSPLTSVRSLLKSWDAWS